MELNIPQRLKDLRKEAGFTQQVVADGISIKRTAYQAYEEGRAIPPFDTLMSLSSFYGFYSIDKLMGITEGSIEAACELMTAYHSVDPEKRKIVDFILNLNC